MENKKWTREEAEQNKNKLLQELQQEPFNTSGENLEWVTKELNQLIDEEEERQKVMNKSKQVEDIATMVKESLANSLPKMYHPIEDSISIPLIVDGKKIVVEIKSVQFVNNLDKDYQTLLQDILDNGVEKKDRTGTGTISVFGRQIRHKMSDGFPLLTTKKMAWKTMVTELLWQIGRAHV